MTTRNQLERLIAIHDRLITGLHYSLSELRDACERRTDQRPSVRTLLGDLETLRSEPYNAPIPKHIRNGKPYRYDGAFSLFGVLHPGDAALANEAVALVRQMQTLPQFAGLEAVMLKFEQQPGVIGKPRQSVVQFEQNERYQGLQWLQPLYQAMQDDRPVLVHYADFDQTPERFTLSPYLLKEYNNRWHVYGWANERNGLINIALDRISAVRVLTDLRRRPDTTDWDRYLADVIGFTRYADAPPETWVLRVWLPRARYVETKPLHPSQREVGRSATYVDFGYELRWNRELDARILELGPDAELLEPAHRRAAMASAVQRMGDRYNAQKGEFGDRNQ